MSKTFNMVGGGGGKAALDITVTNGTATSVTATKDGSSISLIQTGGTWFAVLPSFGIWTVSATDGTRSQTDTVNASVAGLYTLTLRLQDVPNAYTQLEWISSTNGAEIDTGYSAVSTSRIYTKVQSTRSSSDANYWDDVFTQVEGTGSTRKIIILELHANHHQLIYYNGVGTPGSDAYSISLSTVYTISTQNRTVTINGTTKSVTASSGFDSTTATMKICRRFKMWYFQMTASDATTIVRDMVPAKRLSDSVVGMYDKVNGVFYTSYNSYTFTAGPEAN